MRTATPRSTQAGSNVVEGVLVEQRVAVREQHDVDVGLTHEACEHRRLVHAGADGPHDALRPELLEGRPRPVDGGLPVVVRVVDEGDVDPIQAEAFQALVERSANAVGAVVEDQPDRLMTDVVGVVAISQPLTIEVGSGRDIRLGPDQAADLGRHDEGVPWPIPQRAARPGAPMRRSRTAGPCRRRGCRGPRRGGRSRSRPHRRCPRTGRRWMRRRTRGVSRARPSDRAGCVPSGRGPWLTISSGVVRG